MAFVLAASVLASGWVASTPLPILGWAAAFLFFAVERDVHCQRIPNALTFPAFAVALAHGAITGGAAGALAAGLGAAAAFALLLLPYAVGALGAGDVKAAMALGAGFGAAATLELLLLAIGFGGALALGPLLVRGELPALARRWGQIVVTSLVTRRLFYVPPPHGSAASRGIPFAVAIALAVVARQMLEIL